MPERYELIYGFVHCRGKTSYSAGYVDTQEEAEAWVRNHREGTVPKMKIPLDDPIRYCLASFCPFKKQQAWFDVVCHQIELF